MNTIINNALKDRNYLLGLVLITLAAIAFLLTEQDFLLGENYYEGSFFFAFAFFLLYFIFVIAANKRAGGRWFRFAHLRYNILLLLLANLSAYSLNRSIPVFQESTEWLMYFVLLLNGALLLFSLRQSYRPDPINYFLVAVMGAGLLFSFYQSLYVMPFYVIGVFGFWFFGVPLHIFVPVWTLILLGKILSRYLGASTSYRHSLLAGLALPMGLVLLFCVRWNEFNEQIELAYYDQDAPTLNQELPPWVNVSQRIDLDWISRRALMSGIIYPETNMGHFTWLPNNISLREKRQHDPLVVIATLFSGKIDLKVKEKVKLLQSLYNERHHTQRRLWSGDQLSTVNIQTSVQLFPDYRIAYTEKQFKIHHNNNNRWRRQQEALYTFYLPEGAVATSASLWINGVEEPSYLTTREKADSAYRTIVGVERRDPMLVHWQEGNRLTIRVFPCTPDEDRQFKIGISSPLRYDNQHLYYQNIDFQGPDWQEAIETIDILMEGREQKLESSLSLDRRNGRWAYTGSYQSNWQLEMTAPTLANEAFTFNGQNYQLETYRPEMLPFSAEEIYLDINQAWTPQELDQIYAMTGERKLYVYTGQMEQVTEANRAMLFKELQELNYSLFPFHQIKQPAKALVISKYSGIVPTLNDLEKTPFLEKLNAFSQKESTPLRIFNLGEDWSAYQRCLKEIHFLLPMQGDLDKLRSILRADRFLAPDNDPDRVLIGQANMCVRRGKEGGGIAPDHLLRLFAYNSIMRQVGPAYFSKDYVQPSLIEAAKEAYVVSPVSSLVVLESQQDYERFGIEESNNSLKNASIAGSGAVPEPAEWLMIVLCLLLALFLHRRLAQGNMATGGIY